MDELTKLHEKGMVHGEIRVFNMLFFPADDAGKPHVYLIDVDFGGTDRKKENDWVDLANVMFKNHTLKMPVGQSHGDLANMMVARNYRAEKFEKGQRER